MAPCSMRPRPLHAAAVDSTESRAASAADAAAHVVSETDTAMVVAATTAAVVAAAVDAAANDATAQRTLARERPWALRPGSPREGVVGRQMTRRLLLKCAFRSTESLRAVFPVSANAL